MDETFYYTAVSGHANVVECVQSWEEGQATIPKSSIKNLFFGDLTLFLCSSRLFSHSNGMHAAEVKFCPFFWETFLTTFDVTGAGFVASWTIGWTFSLHALILCRRRCCGTFWPTCSWPWSTFTDMVTAILTSNRKIYSSTISASRSWGISVWLLTLRRYAFSFFKHWLLPNGTRLMGRNVQIFTNHCPENVLTNPLHHSIDWLIDWFTNGLFDLSIDWLIYRWVLCVLSIDWLIYQWAVRFIDWLIDWLIDLPMGVMCFVHWLIDWFTNECFLFCASIDWLIDCVAVDGCSLV